jgi:putative addiction module component (TIGR02574 family)
MRQLATAAAVECFAIIRRMEMDLTKQAKNLSIPERIRLVEEIWNTIAEENEAFELTDTQKSELDRRLALARTNPSRGRTWEEIKAEFMNSHQQ